MSLRARVLEEQEKEFWGDSGGGGDGFFLPFFNHPRKSEDIRQENFSERNDFSGLFFGEGIRVVGSIISIIPNYFPPFAQVFCKHPCRKERVEPFWSTSYARISSQFKCRSINHFSACHSTTIRISPVKRVYGLKKEHGNIVRHKPRSFRDRWLWVNFENSVAWLIFNGRWMVRRGRGIITGFDCCTNPLSTPIAMEIGCPPDKEVISEGVSSNLFLHFYFRNLRASDFFPVAMRTCNREYCHV